MFFVYHDRRICVESSKFPLVIIEANDHNHANEIAQAHDMYCSGTYLKMMEAQNMDDMSCVCHGDRWLPQIEGMGYHTLTEAQNGYTEGMRIISNNGVPSTVVKPTYGKGVSSR